MVDYKALEELSYPGQFSQYDMRIIVPEIQKLEPGEIYLEIGVDRGRSLWVAREMSKPGVRVIGIDIQDDPRVPDTRFIKGDSVDVAKKWSPENRISLLFIDGDHTYEGCKRDIEAWFPHMKEGGMIFFHDCDETSPGVVMAVAEAYIKNRDRIKAWKMFRNEMRTSMAALWL